MDTFNKKKRSDIMRAVHSYGNKSTENAFRSALKHYHIKKWLSRPHMKYNPDFIFPNNRLAIFIDGCFWHGCRSHLRLPKTNISYWKNKIISNIKRDNLNRKELKKLGWKVIRVWEHSLKGSKSIKGQIDRIKKHL